VTVHRQLSRLLGSGILLLVAGTLALSACNSNSVSGSQPNASKATNAEAKSSQNLDGARSRGLIDAANDAHSQGLIGAAVSKTR
jgi:hypothetical protein